LEGEMSERVCYVVGISDVEGFYIRHICLSEKTAKAKFIEVRDAMIIDVERMHARNLERKRFMDTFEGAAEALRKLKYPGTEYDFDFYQHPMVQEHWLLD
jgi:hypothetical protein